MITEVVDVRPLSPEETATEAVFEGFGRVKGALLENPDYARQEEETRFEIGSMPTPIVFQLGSATYEERIVRRISKSARDWPNRNHETRTLVRTSQNPEEGRRVVQFTTTTPDLLTSESNRMGEVMLFMGGGFVKGQDALDTLDSAFPELFPPQVEQATP